jgi:xanthine dehydrogenase accessory factor
MITGALTRTAEALTAQGAAFVTATVVRVQHPTSVKPGDTALVRADGTIDGFVGGECAQQSVRLYALKAIERGEPLLLRILPEAGGAVEDEDGTVTVQNPCLSGGAIEVFLEPFLPPPRVVVVGETPIADALRRLAPELGLIGSAGPPAREDLALVVAAHGRDELDILRSGLEAGARYVGLVASRRRGHGVIEELRAAGVADALLDRIESPAGLDIGARTPAEIALSILARIIEVRRGERGVALGSDAAGARAEPVKAIDPICGMTIAVVADTPSVQNGEETVYFCCDGCRRRYLEAA